MHTITCAFALGSPYLRAQRIGPASQHYGVVGERLGAAKSQPASTVLGVARLAFPELMIEIEATAVA